MYSRIITIYNLPVLLLIHLVLTMTAVVLLLVIMSYSITWSYSLKLMFYISLTGWCPIKLSDIYSVSITDSDTHKERLFKTYDCIIDTLTKYIYHTWILCVASQVEKFCSRPFRQLCLWFIVILYDSQHWLKDQGVWDNT